MLRFIAATFFLAGTLVASPAQTLTSFEVYSDTVSTNSSALVAGDFNNDGKPDLVECCNTSGQMVTRFGNGDGTFQAPAIAFSVPVGYYTAATADVNRDGKLDLLAIGVLNPPATPASAVPSFLVWLGNGNGTFQNPQSYTLAQPANTIVIGNFFGASQNDVAVAEPNSNIELFQNQGNGTYIFKKALNVVSGSSSATSIVAADLNGTGITDIAVMNKAGTDGATPQELFFLWNDGEGNFTQKQYGGDYDYPVMTTSRLNGVAQGTLLVGHTCMDNLNCFAVDAFYGQGDNNVIKRTLISSTAGTTSGNVSDLRGIDVNGDGYGDIVAFGDMHQPSGAASFETPAGAAVWLGQSDGSFQQTPQLYFSNNVGSRGAIAAEDFNRDGLMDFAEGNPVNNGTTTYYINASSSSSCNSYTVSPTVTVCQPADNTYSPIQVHVKAASYDTAAQVTQLQQYIDGTLKYSQAGSSFDQTFTLTPGAHLLVTKAWDTKGISFVAERNINVYNGTPGPTCATGPNEASLCTPANMTSDEPVVIIGNGNTGNNIPTTAQLYIDNRLVVNNSSKCSVSGGRELCYNVNSSLIASQHLTSGTHLLTFKVWDIAGHVYEASRDITVN